MLILLLLLLLLLLMIRKLNSYGNFLYYYYYYYFYYQLINDAIAFTASATIRTAISQFVMLLLLLLLLRSYYDCITDITVTTFCNSNFCSVFLFLPRILRFVIVIPINNVTNCCC